MNIQLSEIISHPGYRAKNTRRRTYLNTKTEEILRFLIFFKTERFGILCNSFTLRKRNLGNANLP